MKIKQVKIENCFPFNKFELKKNGYKFIADVYPDGGGWFEMTKGKEQLQCRENGTIDDWISDISNQIKELIELQDFLLKVKYEQNRFLKTNR